MDYEAILEDIKPTTEEKEHIDSVSKRIMDFLQNACNEKGIDAKVTLVGSVAKNTALKGKSDIDIFIAFPLDTDKKYLKEKGLELAHECCTEFDVDAEHHFASHPYVTTVIEECEVDIVPCYSIKDGSELKSAVDRTILHTRYVKANLSQSQQDEVLLLKRFMAMTGTYGSEFKVGGFAGYLCELLIIHYGTFEETLKAAVNWKYGHVIDLEKYGTSKNFKDPLIVIDPTDENRNVGAALRLDKMAEFIQSARNYLFGDNKKDYFYPLPRELKREDILNEFKLRNSDLIAFRFDIPDMPLDTLHPQLRKTCEALERKLNSEEFNVFKADYWSDEVENCVILLEMASSRLNDVKVNVGPKVFITQACENFVAKYGRENCYIQGDFLVHTQKRQFNNAVDLITFIFTKEHIGMIKVGKNLKNILINTFEFIDVADIDLEFLDDFLNPGQHISR
ncbi:MAG: CCA tRNA nucleotidyltransferase [Methanobrevibacter thaueri]|jgi:tRNA nucleotidyltransferase (CCA-adding enzyme)|uniref:CCA tRNA nucleotidyltransferase n=1 Tax=Methanobrevibacter thaueri TaxID=190975 RepID=UPI0026E9A35E|nr:CCA tRNA nucleotidyltransferase [Methanobrevibacter thaueri]MBE6496099.1 CCA tRNA nucleotidyltransferase [Methanobrevibacter thaueri]